MRHVLPALVATTLTGFAVSQVPLPSAQIPGSDRHRCGTPTPTGPLGPSTDHPDCDLNNTNPAASYAPTFVYRIPVVVHVIQSTGGAGNLSDTLVRSQITVLNEDFRAIAGTPGAPGTDTMIEFYLATTDPSGAPTTGIRRYTNNTWFGDNGNYWTSIAWNTQRYLNIYTNNVGNGSVLGYVPDIPQGGSVLNTSADRVVILWDAFGRPGVGGAPYNQGRTCTHEVGHYLGLFHTFENGCGTASCFTTGDRICDTNAESNPRFGCPTTATSCSSLDPVRNYMDYTDDTCMTNFTAQQARRMRCTIQHYRPLLAQICPAATAVTRNAGTNLNIYTAQPPRIGQNYVGNLVLLGTGYQFGALAGFVAPANVPLGILDDRILMNLGSLQVFQTGFTGGIVAQFLFPIPFDTNLCGLPLATQGFIFGGAPDFRATNAVDMVVGS
jgi:hypothetical protein